ncbi:MAG TPA: aminotransferase class IV [Thermoanaerobaculia bacterium]
MTGLFETMLAVDGRIVQLDEHVQRMARSCRELGWEPLDEDAFRSAANAIVQTEEHAVRVIYDHGALTAERFAIPHTTRSRRIHGRAVTLDPAFVRAPAQHKRVPEDLALRDLIPPDADECLFVTGNGRILEGTGTNVFAVRDDVLITAPDRVLPGIVRAWVLATAPTLGLRIEERAPAASDVHRGAFFTGSLTTLAPIRVLNGRPCAAPGPAYEELREMFRRRVTLNPS